MHTKGVFTVKKFFAEFKAFAFKGNVLDMAVGVLVATAFNKIVSSLVNDVFMPVLSLLTGGVSVDALFVALGEGEFETAAAAAEAGVATLNYGQFLQNVIDFLLIALSVFVFVKVVGSLKKKEEAPAPAPASAPAAPAKQAAEDAYDSEAVAGEISQSLEAMVGTTHDAAPKAAPQHPSRDTTSRFSNLNLQFGRNYDPTQK